MTSKTHIIGGIALAGAIQMIGLEFDWIEGVGYYGLSVLGALLPDIDHPKSLISQNSFGLYKLFKGLGHRGATHSLFVPFILQIVLLLIFKESNMVLGFGIGYLSHLLLDLLNPRGIPLIYPVDKKKFRIARIRTGESGEDIVAIGLFIVAMYTIWQILI